jgi:hypothetical protein
MLTWKILQKMQVLQKHVNIYVTRIQALNEDEVSALHANIAFCEIYLGFLGFPHGFELLGGNIHDRDELPSGESTMSRSP